MAVLLERRFRQFRDGLVTTVEMAEHPEHARDFNQEMLRRTSMQARAESQGVRVGEVFRLSPLITKIVLALAVVTPIGALYALNAQAVQIWAQRLYLLRDQTWPRNTEIQVAGIQIEHTATTDGAVTVSELMPFDENREIKVAKGTSVLLRVQADATKVIPEYCTVYYQTEEDDRGSVNMQKLGRIRDNYPGLRLRWKTVPRDLVQHRLRCARLRSPRARLSLEGRAESFDRRDEARLVSSRLTWWTKTCRCGCRGPWTWPTARSCPTGPRSPCAPARTRISPRSTFETCRPQQTTVYDVAQHGQ